MNTANPAVASCVDEVSAAKIDSYFSTLRSPLCADASAGEDGMDANPPPMKLAGSRVADANSATGDNAGTLGWRNGGRCFVEEPLGATFDESRRCKCNVADVEDGLVRIL